MKKQIIMLALTAALFVSGATANAASIPRETAPINATEEQTQIVENLIGGYLDEINAGAGYGMIASEADTKIYKAVLAGETNGNGYAILSAISQNALRTCRDMYMRPEVYRLTEENLRVRLADILAEVENGMDIDEARKQAHTKIYQSINPSYTPPAPHTDFCYADTPAVDMAVYTVTNKLLIEAHTVYLQR
ncbi:MAG: hypothetical protein IJH17_04790 [Clostridia bacterium]|nr:hypothetical protein [Clostridia bacterium]